MYRPFLCERSQNTEIKNKTKNGLISQKLTNKHAPFGFEENSRPIIKWAKEEKV